MKLSAACQVGGMTKISQPFDAPVVLALFVLIVWTDQDGLPGDRFLFSERFKSYFPLPVTAFDCRKPSIPFVRTVESTAVYPLLLDSSCSYGDGMRYLVTVLTQTSSLSGVLRSTQTCGVCCSLQPSDSIAR